MSRSLYRAFVFIAVAVFTAACGSSASPPPPPPAPQAAAADPPPAQPESAVQPEPAAQPEPEAAPDPGADPGADPAPAEPPAPRTAPERWWHEAMLDGDVPSTNLDEAHELLAGRTPAREVIVAVIDGGVDTAHEDLDDVLWVNPGEVAGNGVDDDGNGYVDDVHGWNFIGGADGQNVQYDTYEMTRIHAACIGGSAAGPMESPGQDLCDEVASSYEEERVELTQISEQITQIQSIYPILVGILTGALGGEEPTMENVSALQTMDPRTAEAKNIFLQLAAAGIDEELLESEGETIQNRLQYGLDTAFDPRPIVGDDYADPTETGYGNPDVTGPDPSHGTAVASVVAAERDNGVGIEGAANGARIMAIRAVPDGDERDKDVANAIRYAVDNGAHVINMSFGKGYSPEKSTVDEAVRYADAAGVLMVHASGNDGADLAEGNNFPTTAYADGDAPNLWIEVGASGWQARDSLAAAFSNYGTELVDVFAPGVAIMSAAPGNEYEPADGTSLASPVVSGIAALLMAYFPDLDAADVRRIILETATDAAEFTVVLPGTEDDERVLFGTLSVTGGVVNAAEAVRQALQEEQQTSP